MKPAPTAKPGAPPVAESDLVKIIMSQPPPHKKVVTIACFTAPGQEPRYSVLYENKRVKKTGASLRLHGFPCGSMDEALDPSAAGCAKRKLLEEFFNAPIMELLKGKWPTRKGIEALRSELSAALRGRTARAVNVGAGEAAKEVRALIIAARAELIKARKRAPKQLVDRTELEPLLEDLREELKDVKASAGTTSRTAEEISADIAATETELAEARKHSPAMSERNFVGDFTVKKDLSRDLYFAVYRIPLHMDLGKTCCPGPEQDEAWLATKDEIRKWISKGEFFHSQARAWEDVFAKLQNHAATAPTTLAGAAKPSAPAVARQVSQFKPAPRSIAEPSLESSGTRTGNKRSYHDAAAENLKTLAVVGLLHPRLALAGIPLEIENIYHDINSEKIKRIAKAHARKKAHEFADDTTWRSPHPKAETDIIKDDLRWFMNHRVFSPNRNNSIRQFLSKGGGWRHNRSKVNFSDLLKAVQAAMTLIAELKNQKDPSPIICKKCGCKPNFFFRQVFDAIPGDQIEHRCRCNYLIFTLEVPNPMETVLPLPKTIKQLMAEQLLDDKLSETDFDSLKAFFETSYLSEQRAK